MYLFENRISILQKVKLIPLLYLVFCNLNGLQAEKSSLKDYQFTIPSLTFNSLFEKNIGQVEYGEYVLYTSNYTVYFDENKISFEYLTPDKLKTTKSVSFQSAQPTTSILPGNSLPTRLNYFNGSTEKDWFLDVPYFENIRYKNVYNNIDILCYVKNDIFEFDFIIHKGGDPNQIKIKTEISSKDVFDDVIVFDSLISLKIPNVYEEVGTEKIAREASFALIDDNILGFDVGEYNKENKLIIDPQVIYSTYFAAENSDEEILDMAVDEDGLVYITGTTGNKFFIAKFLPGNSTFDFLNIFPVGVVPEREIVGRHILLDRENNIIIAGQATDASLPVKNAFQSNYGGIVDAFLMKLTNDGDIIFSTYMGGSKVDPDNNPLKLNGRDYTSGIVVDKSNNIYIYGETDGLGFPGAGGNLGSWDIFFSKVNPDGGLIYTKLIGGPNRDRTDTDDFDQGIAIDSQGLIYILGYAEEGFPIVGDALDNEPDGPFSRDGTLSILNEGGGLIYSTFLPYEFEPTHLYINSKNNVIMAGLGGWPLVNSVADVGETQIVVLDHITKNTLYSTYLPGKRYFNSKLYLTQEDQIFFGARPNNNDILEITDQLPEFENATERGIYVFQIDLESGSIPFSTKIGGSGFDYLGGLVKKGNQLYLGGGTTSQDYYTTDDKFPNQQLGNRDAFLSIISLSGNPVLMHDANPKFLATGFLGIGTVDSIQQIKDPKDLDRALLREINGTTADGASKILLTLEFDKMVEDCEIDLENDEGIIQWPWGKSTVDNSGAKKAYAIYKPPIGLSSASKTENFNQILGQVIKTSAKCKSENETITQEINIPLIHPPVVLVHGTFDNPVNCWKTPIAGEKSMFQSLQAAGYYVTTVDYQDSNGDENGYCSFFSDVEINSFECNKKVVYENPGGIAEAIEYYRVNFNVAATRTDVIGHSMGGVLPRVYASDDDLFDTRYNDDYYRNDNYNQGDISRLITIASTHHGSDGSEFLSVFNESWKNSNLPFNEKLANGLVSTVAWFGLGVGTTGAVKDQMPSSRALKRIGPTKIPSHAIVCTVKDFSNIEGNIGEAGSIATYANLLKGVTAYFYFFPGGLNFYLKNRILKYKRLPASLQNSNLFQWNAVPIKPLEKEIVLQSAKPDKLVNLTTKVEEGLSEFWQNWHFLQWDTDPDWIQETSQKYKLQYETAEYNPFEPDDEFNDLVQNKQYDIISGEMPYDEDITESSNFAVDFIRYLIFKNDLNDCVVRYESQTGSLEEPYISHFDKHIHSYAPRYPDVIARILELLNGGLKDFNTAGFPGAGRRLSEAIPNPDYIMEGMSNLNLEPSRKSRFGCEAVCWSGMVPSHAEAFLNIAVEKDIVILGRPVNPDATTLIANDAATKGMNLKGKSANWGPHKGYIPVNQKYSKLWNLYGDDFNKRAEQIKVFSNKTKKQLQNEPDAVVKAPLMVKYDCGNTKEFQVYVDTFISDAEESVFLVETEESNVSIFQWKIEKDGTCPASSSMVDLPLSQLIPLEVMSKPRADDTIYFTADYDLLAIGFKEPGLAGWEDDPYEIPTLTKFDTEKGLITEEQKSLLIELNNEVRNISGYKGGDVSHHGPENQFYILDKPKDSSPYVDYPITAFYKQDGKGIIEAIPRGPRNFRDIYLKKFMAEKRRAGYDLYENIHSPGWSWDRFGKYTYVKGWDDRDDPVLADSPEEIPFPQDCSCNNLQPNEILKIKSDQDHVYETQSFTLFPNPASEFLNVELIDHSKVPLAYTLTNSLGIQVVTNKVLSAELKEIMRIDISKFYPGIYVLTVQFQDHFESQTICIIK
jgi:hypothetical protein